MKRLGIALVILVGLVASSWSAWKMNPHTGKLDYYESGGEATSIVNGLIVNEDVNAAAAIAGSKLANPLIIPGDVTLNDINSKLRIDSDWGIYTKRIYGTDNVRYFTLQDNSVIPYLRFDLDTIETVGDFAINVGASNLTISTAELSYIDNGSSNLQAQIYTALSKGVTILSPTATDNVTLFYTRSAITITNLDSVITGADNVTWFIRHATTRNSSTPDNVVAAGTTTTSASSGTLVTSFDDATIPSGRWVWLQVTALGGTPSSIHVTMYYTRD